MCDGCDNKKGEAPLSTCDDERRKFIQTLAVGAAAAAIPAVARPSDAETLTYSGWAEYFQKNFREMTSAEKAECLKRMEAKYSAKYGKKVTVKGTEAMPGVKFAYALDLNRCVGCRRCVYACAKENNNSRTDPQIHYIKVLKFPNASLDFERADRYYDPETVPEKGHYYVPVQCQHCANPPCVKACPVKATWQEDDNVVVVDYNWCIGCRYCMAACPYEGRSFNWGDGNLKADEVNPDTHYLGNRPRMRGIVEKCHFCLQRTREGRYPACVEICPVGARKFGDIADPNSEVSYVFNNKRVFRLKEELLTEPNFFYFFG